MDKFKVVLSATSYKPKIGALQKDKDGYYLVRLGAFNVFNSQGAFYIAKGVRDLIENENSIFHRRLKKGYLVGEMGHPRMKPGMSVQEFMQRNGRMEPDNVAFHVKDIVITQTGETVESMGNYGDILLVEGWIKPSGPKGPFLKEALDNPHQNVAFSVRSISTDTMVNGIKIKETKAILGWDWVDEPGINNANKFDSINNKVVNTESLVDTANLVITEEDVNEFIRYIREEVEHGTINHESAEDLTYLATAAKEAFQPTGRSKMLNW